MAIRHRYTMFRSGWSLEFGVLSSVMLMPLALARRANSVSCCQTGLGERSSLPKYCSRILLESDGFAKPMANYAKTILVSRFSLPNSQGRIHPWMSILQCGSQRTNVKAEGVSLRRTFRNVNGSRPADCHELAQGDLISAARSFRSVTPVADTNEPGSRRTATDHQTISSQVTDILRQ
jgi:hypothetical protein